MTIMESPEYELCLKKTLSSFKRKVGKDGNFIFKRNPANRLHDLYNSEEGYGQFAVDYILARNRVFTAPSTIRKAVLEVGNAIVQEAAKMITERLVEEKAAGISDETEIEQI